MEKFVEALRGHLDWLWRSIVDPSVHSWFWWLLGISIAVFALELLLPWRRAQHAFRRDFWLDAFYMLFNSIVFPALGFAAAVKVFAAAFDDLLASIDVDNLAAIEVTSWPVWTQWLVLLVVRDFAHWNIHRILHRVPWLWEFHKVHHSVREMGFAAHLRFHWMETVVYTTLEALPLALVGFGVSDFLVVHLFALTLGHLNHANVGWSYGPLRYVFNSPAMHIWHHAWHLPPERRHGVNFGLTFSVWDWLFGTAWWPRSGRDEELGFDGVEQFPASFATQVLHPWTTRRRNETTR